MVVTHFHLRVCCSCFEGSKIEGLMALLQKQIFCFYFYFFQSLMFPYGKSWKSPGLRRVLPLKFRECELLAVNQQFHGLIESNNKEHGLRPECFAIVTEEYTGYIGSFSSLGLHMHQERTKPQLFSGYGTGNC